MSGRLTFFVHLRALPAWLALSRPQRHTVIEAHVDPVLAAHPDVTIRWFDAEAFSASPSDVLMAQTDNLTSWTDLFEQLRDTPLWSVPYFAVEQIVTAVEDGYVEFEQRSVAPDTAP